MVKGRKTGGRIKGVSFNKTPEERTAAEQRRALARKAQALERKATQAKATQREVAVERKALAMEAISVALQALKALAPALQAAVFALETLMTAQQHGGRRANSGGHRPGAGRKPRIIQASTPAGPPAIRQIRTIITEDGVKPAEAKLIQEAEIVARAEWRPSNIALNGSGPTTRTG